MNNSFIGREEELALIQEAFSRSTGLVAVIGAPGVGKSRLCAAVEEELRKSGQRVVTLAGSEGTRHIQLGAFASLLPHEPTQNEAQLIGHILRELTITNDDVAVSVDDAHLLDDVSLGCLTALIHAGIPVLATITRPAPTSLALDELLLAATTTQLSLGPLSTDDIRLLASEQLHGPLEEHAARAVSAAARGNPLFLREILADATASGAIVSHNGTYQLVGELPVLDRVSRLVRTRIDRLSSEQVDLVEMVALAEQLPLAALNTAADELLPDLENMALVKVARLGDTWVVRPGHPSVSAAVDRTLSNTRRLRLLRTLCETTTEISPLPSGLARTAVKWYRELGLASPTDVAVTAAWESLVALDLEQAQEQAQPLARKNWRASFVLAEICRWQNDVEGAFRHLARATELAPDPLSLRRVVMARSALEAWQRGDIPQAIAVLRKGAAQANDAETAAFLLCEAAMLATLLGDFDDAVTSSRAILDTGPADPITLWNTAMNLSYAQIMFGDLTDVSESLKTARLSYGAVRHEQPEGADLLASMEAGAALLSADFRHSKDPLLERLIQLKADGSPTGSAAAVAADVLLFAGDDRALSVALDSVDQLRVTDAYGTLPLGLAHATIVQCSMGNRADALELAGTLGETMGDMRSVAASGRARAYLAAEFSRSEAAEIAWSAGIEAVTANHVTVGAIALFEGLVYSPTRERCAALAKACEHKGPKLLGHLTDIARALEKGSADSVLEISKALIHDSGAPYLAALTLTAWAQLCTEPLESRRAHARASAALADSPKLRNAPIIWQSEDGLSSRELEIALYASSGLTNKLIGEKLFLSARTVGNHLYAVYSKLDVTGRSELSEVLAL